MRNKKILQEVGLNSTTKDNSEFQTSLANILSENRLRTYEPFGKHSSNFLTEHFQLALAFCGTSKHILGTNLGMT